MGQLPRAPLASPIALEGQALDLRSIDSAELIELRERYEDRSPALESLSFDAWCALMLRRSDSTTAQLGSTDIAQSRSERSEGEKARGSAAGRSTYLAARLELDMAREACPHWDYESDGTHAECCDRVDAAKRILRIEARKAAKANGRAL